MTLWVLMTRGGCCGVKGRAISPGYEGDVVMVIDGHLVRRGWWLLTGGWLDPGGS